MAINYDMLDFASNLKYMRKYSDFTLPSGGGSINHLLGYVPYFLTYAINGSSLVPIRTGSVQLPEGDFAFYIIDATDSSITILEDIVPTNATTYFIRVYEDPLP